MLLEVTRERPAVLPADRATLLIEHASELVTLGWSFGSVGSLATSAPTRPNTLGSTIETVVST